MKLKVPSTLRRAFTALVVISGATASATAVFLVLPLIQAITKGPKNDMEIVSMDTAVVPPPITEMEEEPPEEEPEEEEPPPELTEEAAPLDLAQLELALEPGLSGSWMTGDFAVNLDSIVSSEEDVDALFSLSDLDQAPRVVYQPSPVLSARVRKKAPGTVYILFIVDKNGRVTDPVVQQSDDPVFEKPALTAVKKWKFEPGRRKGEPVRFRLRVPITFPKG